MIKNTNSSGVELPQLVHPIIQGAYGRRGKQKIVQEQEDLVTRAKQLNDNPEHK